MKKTCRICIYPKDISIITGKTERYGRKLIEKIRRHLSKTENQFVSVKEFCDYTGLNIDEVEPLIID